MDFIDKCESTENTRIDKVYFPRAAYALFLTHVRFPMVLFRNAFSVFLVISIIAGNFR